VLLQVENLQTHFDSEAGLVKAVDDVSFGIAAGEIVGIVGESGSGKSMTAMSIMRLIQSPPGRIVGGRVLFEGRDLVQLDEASMRTVRGNQIAMIFQEPMTSLNPLMTIGRQVAEPLIYHRGQGLSVALAEVVNLLSQVQIGEGRRRLNDYPHQFSGGMRQRAMIAMGLACKPKLMIADEPTTALDVTVQAQILELLRRLAREEGMGLMLITHNLGVVARYCDRVNVMYAGRIVESGTTEQVLTRPRHPYTSRLLRSVPQLDQDLSADLETIPGNPPNLANVPAGCAFHPRCADAFDRCSRERPLMRDIDAGHLSACWANG
jgi:oligopeptide/dipeptide ABC transporter ATP-binding protein